MLLQAKYAYYSYRRIGQATVGIKISLRMVILQMDRLIPPSSRAHYSDGRFFCVAGRTGNSASYKKIITSEIPMPLASFGLHENACRNLNYIVPTYMKEFFIFFTFCLCLWQLCQMGRRFVIDRNIFQMYRFYVSTGWHKTLKLIVS